MTDEFNLYAEKQSSGGVRAWPNGADQDGPPAPLSTVTLTPAQRDGVPEIEVG
jgi:hypothetical protein